MKYLELTGICKEALKEGKCLGCTGLAEENWVEPKQCPYIDKEEQISFDTILGGTNENTSYRSTGI